MKDNEIKYMNSIAQAKIMLQKGIITSEEFLKIEEKLAAKYSLNKLSTYRLNDLINIDNRAIYMIQKEDEYGKDNSNTSTEQDA